VEINGSGFSTNIADDRQTFNGVVAEITMATPAQLTVLVPKGAGTGFVQVSANGEQNPDVEKLFKYDLTATVSAFAGNGTAGATDGEAANASFNAPGPVWPPILWGMFTWPMPAITLSAGSARQAWYQPLPGPKVSTAPIVWRFDAAGNVYVTDAGNNQIKKVTPAGAVSVVAGNGTQGAANGISVNASFNHPSGIALYTNGVIIIADSGNNLLRMIQADGTVIKLLQSRGFLNYPVGLADYGGIVAQQGNNVISVTVSLSVSRGDGRRQWSILPCPL